MVDFILIINIETTSIVRAIGLRLVINYLDYEVSGCALKEVNIDVVKE